MHGAFWKAVGWAGFLLLQTYLGLKQSGLSFPFSKTRGGDRWSLLSLDGLVCGSLKVHADGDLSGGLFRASPSVGHGLRRGQCEKSLVFQTEVLKRCSLGVNEGGDVS